MLSTACLLVGYRTQVSRIAASILSLSLLTLKAKILYLHKFSPDDNMLCFGVFCRPKWHEILKGTVLATSEGVR